MHCPDCHILDLDPRTDDICYWCGAILDVQAFHYAPSIRRNVGTEEKEEPKPKPESKCAGSFQNKEGLIVPTEDCDICVFKSECEDSPHYQPF